jgi:drug/metabolite transporter (DMT)-like permease
LPHPHQGSSGRGSFLGDALCVFTAIAYGVYTTAIKRLVPDDTKLSFQLMFGYLGLFNAIIFLPLLVALMFLAPAVSEGWWSTIVFVGERAFL